MTFVQENKEKNIRIEKMGITDISAVVRMCDQCVGEKLYSESEIRDAAVNPDSFIFLLKKSGKHALWLRIFSKNKSG